jgi:hypothetical protein
MPFLKWKLEQIEEKFHLYQKRMTSRGYEKPLEYPNDLLEQKMITQAKLEVCKQEIAKLEKSLAELNSKKEVVDDGNLLAFGLRCNGSFHGIGTSYYNERKSRAHLDNQFLTLTEDDILIIDDPRSPYNQMRVSDYRKMAKEWLKEREEKERLKFKALQVSCKERGLPVPTMPAVESSKRISKSSLPPWPTYAVPYSPPVEEEDSSSMRRTK